MIFDLLGRLGITYTLIVVALGTFIIAFLAGILSVFFVAQRRSIMGDTIAHSSLPGVVIAFMVIGVKLKSVLLVGALISSVASIMLVLYISGKSKLKEDVSIGITLSFFFSIGIALLTYIQSQSFSGSSGLEEYLFGNVAFLLIRDLLALSGITVALLIVIIIFWKEYKLILFDRSFAVNLGLPVIRLEVVLMILVSFAVVMGIEAIGVVLIAGLLIAPSIAARQWTNSYSRHVFYSGIIGGLSGVMGTVVSAKVKNIPTGPAVIVSLTLLTAISLLIGLKNGILINWLHQRLFHRAVDHGELITLFLRNTNNLVNSNGLQNLEFRLSDYPDLDLSTVNLMADCGYCKWLTDEKCILTYKGVQVTQKVILRGDKR